MGIEHPSHVSRARTTASRMAREAGFDEIAAGQIAICASELAQNIVDHGSGAGLLEVDWSDEALRLVASDRGPGLEPIRAAARREQAGDGEGLSALGRLMDVVELSAAPAGARVEAVKWLHGRRAQPHVAVVQRPRRGEQVCGDGATALWRGALLRMLVVDGLGHGRSAHEAACRAVQSARELMHLPLDEAMMQVHAALVGTRGAAGALVELDLERALVSAACVGNVRVSVLREAGRWSVAGVDSVLGQGRPGSGGQLRVRVEAVRWTPGDVILAWSDGVSSRLQLPCRPAAVASDPVRAALATFGAHAYDNDDATLLVCS